MKKRMLLATLAFSLCLLAIGPKIFAATVVLQPSVSRRVTVCDAWQWIGGSAITWGCVQTPRTVELAGGQVTDQVIASLQEQINQLEARIKVLEH